MSRLHFQLLAVVVLFSAVFASPGPAQDSIVYGSPISSGVVSSPSYGSYYSPNVIVAQPSYSQSYATPAYYSSAPVQSYPVQSYPIQSYPVQSYPTQSYFPSNSTYASGSTGYLSGGGDHVISPDYAYDGPGDMRTHLWNDHQQEMIAQGLTQSQVQSMSLATAQKWHNFFHGSGGLPSERQ